jgi:hypothetical protein
MMFSFGEDPQSSMSSWSTIFGLVIGIVGLGLVLNQDN